VAEGQPAGGGLWRWILGGVVVGGVVLGLLVAAYAVGRHQGHVTTVTAPASRVASTTPARTTPRGAGHPAGAAASVAAGKAKFVAVCSGCHLQAGTTAGGVGPKLQGLGLARTRIATQVMKGGGPMPGNLVTGADLDNVVAYVLSIQR
jgi:mono/diheme cytochrome c family protein